MKFLLGIIVAVQLGMALVTGLRAPYMRSTHIVFAALCAGMALWAGGILSLLFLPGESARLLALKFVYSGAVLMPPVLLHFVWVFPDALYPRLRRVPLLGYIPTALLLGLNWTRGFASAVSNDYVLRYTSAYKYFGIFAALCFVMALAILFLRGLHRTQRANPRFRYVMTGLLLTFAAALVSNLFLPRLLGHSRHSFWGPVWTLFFIVPAFVAIVRDNLFSALYLTRKAAQWAYPVGIMAAALGGVHVAGLGRFWEQALVLAAGALFARFTQGLITGFLDRRVFVKIREEKTHLEYMLAQLDQCMFPRVFLTILKKSLSAYAPGHYVDYFVSREYAYWLYEQPHAGPCFEDVAGQLSMLYLHVLPLEDRGRIVAALCFLPRDAEAHMEAEKWLWLQARAGALAQSILRIARQEMQKELDRKLAHNEKLITLGQLSSSLLHEIKNPLTGIALNAELIEETLSDGRSQTPVELLNHARTIQSTVALLRDKLDTAVSFSRKDRCGDELFDTAPVVDNMLRLIERQAQKQGVRVVAQHAAAAPMLRWQANKLAQVLLNLCLNAIEAMPGGGELRVEESSSFENGRYCYRLTVRDTGMGLTEEQRQSMFEPFVTFKAQGTGLGLAVVKQLVDERQGCIDVRSQLRQGTEFVLTLPFEIVAQQQVLVTAPEKE